MSRRSFSIVVTALVALVAYYVSLRTGQTQSWAYDPPVQGRNNTALFVILAHHGFSNVHLATAHALLERHPQIDVQIASFPQIRSKIERISTSVTAKDAKRRPVGFHSLPGRDSHQIVLDRTGSSIAAISPRGTAGIDKFCQYAQWYQSPWTGPEHYEIYQAIGRIIDDVDPSVVVLDTLFAPAAEATRQRNRPHVNISPNTLVDLFSFVQPWAAGLWKYPMMGSGLPYPIPWHLVPSNIYQVLRVIPKMLYSAEISEKRRYLKERGIEKPLDSLEFHREDAPWISQATPGATIPLDFLPANVSAVGPMTLSLAPIEKQDPELQAWLGRAPTIMINLGSAFVYDEDRAKTMAAAVKHLLDQTNHQILWKFTKETSYSDDFAASLQGYLESGRLRLSQWLTADPTSILESGLVEVFVHHGGSSSYHEALATGVPQVILPLWADLYNFAALVEPLNLGVWGCPETSPTWTSECIYEAVMKLVNDNEESRAVRDKVQDLGRQIQADPGRYAAARIVAGLAGSGK